MELKRILLVDDSENDVELMLSALAEYNLANRVDIATDGVDALDYLYLRGRHAGRKFGNPMVVLLDLKLPKLNGLEVLKVIKEDPALRLMPVVILTSSRESSDVLEGYGMGANAFVVKPVDFTHFVKVIKELGYFWVIINEMPPDLSFGTST